MTHDDAPTRAVAVCEKGGPKAAAMQAHLQAEGLADARWFTPNDVDDVDEAVRDGRVDRVVFSDLADLLDAIWDEEIQFDRWQSAGVAVSFVTPPVPDTTASAVYESWRAWQRRHKRRRAIAGAVLTVVALAAACLLAFAAS